MRNIVKDEFEEEINSQKILEIEVKGKTNSTKAFQLTLNQAKQILVRESKFVRKAMIHYIEELEKQLQSQFRVPTTFKEALQLALEQQERIEALELKQEEDKPKVELVEAIIEEDKYFDANELSKMLNIDGYGRNNLLAYMRGQCILNRHNKPYQYYVSNKMAKVVPVQTSIGVVTKTVYSIKMVEYLRKKLLKGDDE